jgi:hypothetical protein
MEDQIGRAERLQGHRPHALLQEVGGLEQPREIVEDELGLVLGAEPHHRQTSRLGLRGDNGKMLSDQGIQQGRFPHVGRPCEGDVAGALHGG